MAFIGESRKDSNCNLGIYVCLDTEECELVMKAVGPLVGRYLNSVIYYKEKLESGEANDKMWVKLHKAEKDFENIISIRDTLLEMIRNK